MSAWRPYALAGVLCLSGSLTGGSPTLAAQGAPGGDAVENPVASQPLAQLSATHERPLFSLTRRPPPKPAAPVVSVPEPPPPPPPPSVIVVGIVSENGVGRAAIRNGEKVIRVRAGDEVGGWTVDRIDPRRLVLTLGQRSVDFALFSTQSKGVKAADAAASQGHSRQMH